MVFQSLKCVHALPFYSFRISVQSLVENWFVLNVSECVCREISVSFVWCALSLLCVCIGSVL